MQRRGPVRLTTGAVRSRCRRSTSKRLIPHLSGAVGREPSRGARPARAAARGLGASRSGIRRIACGQGTRCGGRCLAPVTCETRARRSAAAPNRRLGGRDDTRDQTRLGASRRCRGGASRFEQARRGATGCRLADRGCRADRLEYTGCGPLPRARVQAVGEHGPGGYARLEPTRVSDERVRLREGGRVEERRVAARASVALPALSPRAAVRRPWIRFLPPLSESGVPLSAWRRRACCGRKRGGQCAAGVLGRYSTLRRYTSGSSSRSW